MLENSRLTPRGNLPAAERPQHCVLVMHGTSILAFWYPWVLGFRADFVVYRCSQVGVEQIDGLSFMVLLAPIVCDVGFWLMTFIVI